MVFKHKITISLLLIAMIPQIAFAETVDEYVEKLEAENFTIVKMYRSFFGRTVIVSQNDGVGREVVINPRTGELLRDRTYEIDSDRDDSNSSSNKTTKDKDPKKSSPPPRKKQRPAKK